MLFDMLNCGGCRTCELACSFHHTREFGHEASSIKILDKKDGKGFLVMLVEESDGRSIPCDGCQEREVPLCIEYCEERDDLKPMIDALMQAKQREKS